MDRLAQILIRSGCLVSLLAAVAAFVLYPRANWLFLLTLAGITLSLLSTRFIKDPKPQEIADSLERLLSGSYGGWDIDDYEHLNPRDPEVRELWRESMEIGGLPEEWGRLDEGTKNKLRDVVQKLRTLNRA